MYQQKIYVGNNTYTLTATRSIIKTIYKIAPEMLNIAQTNADDGKTDAGFNVGIDLMVNLDILFYDLIKIAHSNLTKEQSDEILAKLESECENADQEIIEFAMSSFTQGNQATRKSIWKR